MNGAEELMHLGVGRICQENGIEFREPVLIPEIGNHLAAVGALDIPQDGGERIILFPIRGWAKREVGRCSSGWSAHDWI